VKRNRTKNLSKRKERQKSGEYKKGGMAFTNTPKSPPMRRGGSEEFEENPYRKETPDGNYREFSFPKSIFLKIFSKFHPAAGRKESLRSITKKSRENKLG
jgi:hypothetical protein